MKKAPCKDCGKDTQPKSKQGEALFKKWDYYIVRDEIWEQAEMKGWNSGFLCTPCLSKRLGRKLTRADYLAWPVGVTDEGLEIEAHPDYLEHPSVKKQRAVEIRAIADDDAMYAEVVRRTSDG